MATRRALIIGGSMAGLFAGHFLRRAGWQVDIFERTPGPLSARGAGIMTHPELRTALAALGLETERDFGVPITTRAALGQNDEIVASQRFPQIATSWTRVYMLLAEAFPVAHYHRGADLVRIDQAADGVTAHFAGGRTEVADLLVGADGFRSTVRRRVLPDVTPQYAGYVAWRGLITEAQLDDTTPDCRSSLFSFCLPEGEQICGYLVAGVGNDLRPGHRNYNFVWYRPTEPLRELPRVLTDKSGVVHEMSIPPHLIDPAVIAEMRAHADTVLSPWFRAVIERTANPFLQPIYDLSVPRMAVGRVALVGDAAFVVRPHVGGGVLKAADDAQALAAALAPVDTGVTDGLAVFSAARCGIGHRMIAHARRLGSYLKYSYGSEAERAAAAVMAAPSTVLRETALLDFLRSPS